ncbi:unnamed protein product [Citrullus colocynthis]|uniref:Uncharacterized protein n=1 Tax=Citrullus colocynthis TaxID=252529 RepID=A0ABP0XZ65_9ROSI
MEGIEQWAAGNASSVLRTGFAGRAQKYLAAQVDDLATCTKYLKIFLHAVGPTKQQPIGAELRISIDLSTLALRLPSDVARSYARNLSQISIFVPDRWIHVGPTVL